MVFDAIVGVPIDCTGAFAGCERMPAALRAAGLIEALGLSDRGNLQVTLADPRRDPDHGIVALADLEAASRVIRDALAEELAPGGRPLVVGGCCSLLIGAFAAATTRGERVGLAFLDGHLDLYTGWSSPTGEAADLELAVLLGHGPASLTGLASTTPMLEPDRVVHLGARDHDEAARTGALDPATVAPGMHLVPAERIDAHTAATIGRDATRRLKASTDGYWLHLDLDVLSSEAFPAVDYPQPGGLDWSTLAELIRPLLASDHLVGMDVTILNPTKDPDGTCAKRTVAFLADVLPR